MIAFLTFTTFPNIFSILLFKIVFIDNFQEMLNVTFINDIIEIKIETLICHLSILLIQFLIT